MTVCALRILGFVEFCIFSGPEEPIPPGLFITKGDRLGLILGSSGTLLESQEFDKTGCAMRKDSVSNCRLLRIVKVPCRMA